MRASLVSSALLSLLCGSAARAEFVSLGSAGRGGLNLGVFVTGPTTMNASNSGTTFNTNLGLASGAGTNFSGGGTLTGNLYLDPGASLQSNFNSQFNVGGSITPISLATAVMDVKNAASTAAALAPNATYGAVGSSALTLNSTGSINSLGGHDTVVQLSSINITNPANNLTISGGANDYFVINVLGSITVSNGQIQLTGGITASNVLFNVLGSGVTMSNGSSVLNGTFLAPNAGQKITLAPGTVNGAIIAYQIQTSSGPKVNGSPFAPPPPPEPPCPPTNPVPAPAGLLLGLFGAACAVGANIRRRAC
ncbi:MAG: collagen-binding domain-containing protein [Gemmataceae bacterium]